MDFKSYLLLVLAASVGGVKSTDIDEDYTEETVTEGGETHLDRCSELAEKELPAGLHTLVLKKCSMDDLAAINLVAVGNISALQLRDGNLNYLKGKQFTKLPQLQILELQSNFITDVVFDAFEGLSQLWMLALNKNRLFLLNAYVFRPLPELRHLDLSDNRMIGLMTFLFSGNPKLEVLLLGGNNFLSLDFSTFTVLKNLVLLDLRSSGRCKDMELFSAQTIVVDNSDLSRLEVLGEVRELHAPNNKLEYVRLEVKAPVTELNLHGNRLDNYDISELLKGMWRLEILDFSQNLLTELPVFNPRYSLEVSLLPNLKFVNLSRNRLEHLRQDSPLLSSSLTHLDVSYNSLHDIEAHTFSFVDNLQYLYLQGNLISDFKPDSSQLRGLKGISFYDNPIDFVRFCRIKKEFEEAGVNVYEKENSLMPRCKREPLKNRKHIELPVTFNNGAHQATQELRTSGKWSPWNSMILLGLLSSLALDVFLFLQLRRSPGQRYWWKTRFSRVKAKFVRSEGSEILV